MGLVHREELMLRVQILGDDDRSVGLVRFERVPHAKYADVDGSRTNRQAGQVSW